MSLICFLRLSVFSDKILEITFFSFLTLSFSVTDSARLFNTGWMLLDFKHLHDLVDVEYGLIWFTFEDKLIVFKFDGTLLSLLSMLTDN